MRIESLFTYSTFDVAMNFLACKALHCNTSCSITFKLNLILLPIGRGVSGGHDTDGKSRPDGAAGGTAHDTHLPHPGQDGALGRQSLAAHQSLGPQTPFLEVHPTSVQVSPI